MRWTINWKGNVYVGDSDGWNERDTNNWREALVEFTYLNDDGFKCYITDNEYGCTLCWDRDKEEAYWI